MILLVKYHLPKEILPKNTTLFNKDFWQILFRKSLPKLLRNMSNILFNGSRNTNKKRRFEKNNAFFDL